MSFVDLGGRSVHSSWLKYLENPTEHSGMSNSLSGVATVAETGGLINSFVATSVYFFRDLPGLDGSFFFLAMDLLFTSCPDKLANHL